MSTVPNLPIGAVELIIECQQLLAGERKQLGSTEIYKERRQRYWQSQADRAAERLEQAEPFSLAA